MSFTLESYSNPVWVDAAQTTIDADVVFTEIGVAIPFTASKNDPDPHGVTVFDAIVAGNATIPIGAYVPPTLTTIQTAQLAIVSAACEAAITAGFNTTIGGTAYTITLAAQDQSNANFNAATAQAALASTAWAASTTYAANAMVSVGGEILVTFAGGESGTTAPTAPTSFQTAVTDNTITWYRLGFWVNALPNNIMVDPATMITIFGQGVIWINACRSKYQAYRTEILATTTATAAQAIVWQ